MTRCHRSLPSLWGRASPSHCSPVPTAGIGFCLHLFPGRDLGCGAVAGSPFTLGSLTSPSAAPFFISTLLLGNLHMPGTARLGDAPGSPRDPEPVPVRGLAEFFWGCLCSPLPHYQLRQCGIGCPILAPPNSAEIHFYVKSEGAAEAGGCRCQYQLLGQLVMPGEHRRCWEKGGSRIPPCQMV